MSKMSCTSNPKGSSLDDLWSRRVTWQSLNSNLNLAVSGIFPEIRQTHWWILVEFEFAL